MGFYHYVYFDDVGTFGVYIIMTGFAAFSVLVGIVVLSICIAFFVWDDEDEDISGAVLYILSGYTIVHIITILAN